VIEVTFLLFPVLGLTQPGTTASDGVSFRAPKALHIYTIIGSSEIAAKC